MESAATPSPQEFIRSQTIIPCEHPAVVALAATLAQHTAPAPSEIVQHLEE